MPAGRLIANDQIAAHEKLWAHPKCDSDWTRASIVQDVQAGQYTNAQKRLRRWYKHCFHLDEEDFLFLAALADLRNQTSKSSPILGYDEHGNPAGYAQTLLQGHGHVRDFFDANIGNLEKAGLIYYPSIDGKQRKRLIYRPFYCLSSEALDCIDKRVQGPDIGDKGESVPHSLGCRLIGEYLEHSREFATDDRFRAEYFVDYLLPGSTIDVAVFRYDADQRQDMLHAIVEVETGLNREREVMVDFAKLGQLDCPEKYWVAPTRRLANRMLNVILKRHWFDIDPVPETLPLSTGEGVLHNTNRRLGGAEYVGASGAPQSAVPYRPVTEVCSYTDLYRWLKNQYAPTMFDSPFDF